MELQVRNFKQTSEVPQLLEILCGRVGGIQLFKFGMPRQVPLHELSLINDRQTFETVCKLVDYHRQVCVLVYRMRIRDQSLLSSLRTD